MVPSRFINCLQATSGFWIPVLPQVGMDVEDDGGAAMWCCIYLTAQVIYGFLPPPWMAEIKCRSTEWSLSNIPEETNRR
jgi:hypothetical protein